jgi:hypothetical protein
MIIEQFAVGKKAFRSGRWAKVEAAPKRYSNAPRRVKQRACLQADSLKRDFQIAFVRSRQTRPADQRRRRASPVLTPNIESTGRRRRGAQPSRRRMCAQTNRQFDQASLILIGWVELVKRGSSVATGCSARLLRHFRVGTDAREAPRGQAGDRQHELVGRRTRVSGDRGGC